MAEEYLYHYTSVDTLALILKNKTLRFSALTQLDDPVESMTADGTALAEFVFVSSWTDRPEESIPMWREYASVNAGVRIGLVKDPFATVIETPEQIRAATNIPDELELRGSLPTRLSYIRQVEMGVICTTSSTYHDILHKVEYTDESAMLAPVVQKSTDSFVFGLLGKVKPTAWAYQEECRYIHCIIPVNLIEAIGDTDRFVGDLREKLIGAKPTGLPKYIDFPLSEDAMGSMQIVLAPLITPGNEQIVKDAVEKYCPNASVLRSSLRVAW